MGIISERLMKILNSFDEKKTPLSESTIYSELNSLASEQLEGEEQEKLCLKAETMAFSFMEDYSDNRTSWGTYYGPMAVMADENGRWFESPSIQLVTAEILEYWFQRAKISKNPILIKRYADL